MPLLSGAAKKSPHEAVFAMGGQQLKLLRSGRWKLHVRPPQPGFTCLDDASGWQDPRAPDGLTIIAQFEQATPADCPGLVTGPAPKPLMLFDMEADRGGAARRCRGIPRSRRPAAQDLRGDGRADSRKLPGRSARP